VKPRGPFHVIVKDGIVRVWLGPPDDSESEQVLVISKSWLPALIAALKAVL
jgi:hypothetical protein